MTHFLTIEDVEHIAFRYAQKHLAYNEPIPPFNSRFPNQLETALRIPAKSIGGKLMYEPLSKQAGVLFYEMIKLHPFENGNKRIACVTLLTFLMLNKMWMNITQDEIYNLAIQVANSDAQNRHNVLDELAIFLEKNIQAE